VDDTLERVKQAIAHQLEGTEPEIVALITPQTSIKDLPFDSLDIVEVVMKLEEVFNLEIPDEAVEGFVSVQDVVEFIDHEAGGTEADLG
jgi:acyl carrier protein